MSLAEDYRRQFAWRDRPRALAVLPALEDAFVLDLGCGVGDLAAELVARGARVLGVDANEELLAAARARPLAPPSSRGPNCATSRAWWIELGAASRPPTPCVVGSTCRST